MPTGGSLERFDATTAKSTGAVNPCSPVQTANKVKIIQFQHATSKENVWLLYPTFICLHFIKGHIRKAEGGGNIPREDANTKTNMSENERLAEEKSVKEKQQRA